MQIAELFFAENHKNAFNDQGYTVLRLLEAPEVKHLLKLYDKMKLSAGITPNFYTSIWSDNEVHRKSVNEGIADILFPALQKHLKNIQPVFANFMVKASGENSSLLPHQDWSFVEEPLFDSATVWCPLTDVNNANGNLQVIPRSHLLTNFIRARFANAPFRNIEKLEIKKLLVDIPMKAGEAIIINSRTIHASPDNYSGKKRVVASIVITNNIASLYHWEYCQDKKTATLKKHKINSDFFRQYSCYETLQDLVPSEEIIYTEKLFTKEELNSILKQDGPQSKFKRSWFTYLSRK